MEGPLLPNGFDSIFSPKEWRYIKIISGLNPALAQEVRELKVKHEKELSTLSRKDEKTIKNSCFVFTGFGALCDEVLSVW